MFRVVNAEGGTGKQLRRSEIHVAGKTGTAQAAKLVVARYDENGNFIKREALEPSTEEKVNPEAPWYHGSVKSPSLTHAWFIGFAPYDHPRIAFAVMVEYGGGGGQTAGPIAQALITAAEEEGYLPVSPQTASR
jgi:penicillin-binding protein 2